MHNKFELLVQNLGFDWSYGSGEEFKFTKEDLISFSEQLCMDTLHDSELQKSLFENIENK